MTFLRKLFIVFVCFVILLVYLQTVDGLLQPKSRIRSRERKGRRLPILKASLGSTCKLRCSFESKKSKEKVQWLFNNKLLDRKKLKNYRIKKRLFKEILIIHKVKKNDGGVYSCVVAGKRRHACRIIVTSDKKAKCRRKRSVEKVDICKKPKTDDKMIKCKHLNFSKCDSLAGDPEDIHYIVRLHKDRPFIQIQWKPPHTGYNDLWGFEAQLVGLTHDPNEYRCWELNKSFTFTSFTNLVFGAHYRLKLRSLPSTKYIIRDETIPDRCNFAQFQKLRTCCKIVNLTATVLKDGRINLSWKFKCANNSFVIDKFMITWTKPSLRPDSCFNDSKTSSMNYTIDLPSQCKAFNYSIKVYILDEAGKRLMNTAARILTHFPQKEIENLGEQYKKESDTTIKVVVAAVTGLIVGTVLLFIFYKCFFEKVRIKLPSTPLTEYGYEKEDGGTLIQRESPKRVLLMNARCCEKCDWVIHCLGMLLNSTNLIEARTDLWHVQEIASEVMRWYQTEIHRADCVLVMASNIMRRLNDGESIPNRENSDLLDIQAQLNLVTGEMSTKPNTPKFISAYFTYIGETADVPTFLRSRLTHVLPRDLDRLIFHVLKIEAIQPRRTRPIAVIGGKDFDEKKNDLLRAVSEANEFHDPQNMTV